MPNGKYQFFPRKELENNPLVIVVDEVSMLPKHMWDLLCKHNVYIIACGDPAQLPAISDDPTIDPDNHVLDNPHIFLDEIMRQAVESEIIRFSMHIREGKSISSYKAENKEVMMIPRAALSNDMLLWADQCLCATNRTCGQLNDRMRQSLGFSDGPQIGDKILNRHNEWEILSNLGNPLTNGVIGYIQDYVELQNIEYPGWVRKQYGKTFNIPVFWCNMSGDEENENFTDLVMDSKMILEGSENLSGREKFLLSKHKLLIPLTFTYGYGITVWKAQGSQWNKVLLISENWPTDKELYKRYMYTGCTRAVNKLVVIT